MTIEKPANVLSGPAKFGSDVVAETLRDLEIPYIALNPGASFRGLHDSLVNHLGNERPSMLLCLHEEHAVAIAHGYAKVTGRPIAAAVHSNVGLMHASMAIFNAWCDRMPVLVIGATGPVDAAKRRPWIDWIHTARDQGALVRPFVKWDDQPASALAAREAVVRAAWLARTAPQGPVYVNLDSEVQETALEDELPPIDIARFMPAIETAVAPQTLGNALDLLKTAQRPVLLVGRVSRTEAAWRTRVALAETLGARVVTDIKQGAGFPTDHPLHAGAPASFIDAGAAKAIREADLVVSLNWTDLAGTLKTSLGTDLPPRVIQVSQDHVLHNGWSMDHQALPAVDLFFACDPDLAAEAFLSALGSKDRATYEPVPVPIADAPAGPITVDTLGHRVRAACEGEAVSLLHLPLSWNAAVWPFLGPLDYIGSDGGAGIGAGPGISVGAALALRDQAPERLPVAICGDGDFTMGVTALWTAAHYRVPLLIVVANNQSYFNDEIHQERVARMRDRPVENKWIGQRMADPEISMCDFARAQGALGFGPVTDGADLDRVLSEAVAAVRAGAVAVVDVRVQAGYTASMTARLMTSK